jgi:inosose dehydratase
MLRTMAINNARNIIMINKISRRSFIKVAGIGTLASLTGTSSAKEEVATLKKRIPFELGLCSYSLREFKVEQAIEMTKEVGLKYVSLKDIHLPLKSDEATIKEVIAKFNKEDIKVYACGVVYMKTKEEVERAFEYAKAAGIKTIVGVPPHDLLDLIHEKVKEYDIKVAIHNHGPGDKLYPTSDIAYEKIKNMDKRMGLCMDIGHTQRAGQNPAEQIEKYADRMLDFHIKDVSEASAKGSGVVIGTGVIDIPSVIKALIKINYSGVAAFEYEKDGKDPMPGLAKSVEYVRKVLSDIKST